MAPNVKRASEEADRMIAELAEKRKAAEGQPQAEQTDDAVQDQGAITPPEVTDGAVDQTDVGVQTKSEPTVSDSELSSLRKEIETANQRWKVLQGMCDKKDNEIENMRALLAQMSQKPPAEDNTIPETSGLNEDDFDPDTLKMMVVKARLVVKEELKPLLARIAELENSIKGVSEVSAKTSAEVFDDALTRQVPNWRETNVDPAFLAWLQGEDDFTGMKKLDLLADAYSKGDLVRTVKFFTAFDTATGRTAQPVDGAPKADNVTKLITPGKSRSPATPPATPPTEQVWTRADISRLYEDKRNNRITQAEFDKFERDLFKAQSEGRVAA